VMLDTRFARLTCNHPLEKKRAGRGGCTCIGRVSLAYRRYTRNGSRN
jgi:hypothetical protein